MAAREDAPDAALTRKVVDFAAGLGLYAAVAPAVPPPGLRRALRRRAVLGWRAEFEPPEDERRWNPQAVLPGATSVVALALPYGGAGARAAAPTAGRPAAAAGRRARAAAAERAAPTAPAPAPFPRGRVSRYAAGWDYHRLMGWRAAAVAAFLTAHGYRAVWQVDTGPLAERAFAAAAGLGAVGRNGLLIMPGLGTQVFLGLVVTDAPLRRSRPAPFDPCRGCDLCVRACPADALGTGGAVDTTRCISYATQRRDDIPLDQRRALGLWIWGCDVCQDVCPHNRAPAGAALQPSRALGAACGPGERPDLIGLLRLGKGAFRRRWGSSAAAWRGRPVLQRNALVALGNWSRTRAAGAPPEVRRAVWQALLRGLFAPRPELRRHAAWAVAQWPDAAAARAALEERCAVEADPGVRAALEEALAACAAGDAAAGDAAAGAPQRGGAMR
ncbi:MAG: epoxyqueuosine reductase [Firmicutes bacterium]|nr:epoxyqueuosine reductase [Bacillota bacterium]